MPTPFISLHSHSDGSLLDGCCTVKKMVSIAKQQGAPAIAKSDHGTLFGTYEFVKEAKAQGVKPIIACEVYTTPNGHKDRTKNEYNHLVLLAETTEGYKNLVKLVTKASLEGMYYKPRVDNQLLSEYSKGLIALSGCLRGTVNMALLDGKYAEARERATELRDIFGPKNFFLEIQDHGLEEDKIVLPGNYKLSSELGIPLVATNDSHYGLKSDAKAHEALLCIQTGKRLSDPSRMRFSTEEFYIKDRSEMAKLFPDAALDMTWEIAQRCNAKMESASDPFPRFDVPEGFTIDSWFAKVARLGFETRLPKILSAHAEGKLKCDPSAYYERLDYEIAMIQKMKFSAYFLVIHDFLRVARDKGIPVGPGRGSAAGSLVAFSLKITDVDPMQFGLLFERFLNPDRVSMPDCDIDICSIRRGEVIDYVVQKYGAEHTAQIITFGTMSAKAAIKDVARVMDVPFADANVLSGYVPSRPIGITLTQALEGDKSDLKKAVDKSDVAKEVVSLALKMEGMARNAGVHAAGLVISADPIVETIPLCLTKDKAVCTQYPMSAVEGLGLLKMDFLGLSTLTVIDNAVRLIEKHRGVKIVLSDISPEDSETFEKIFCKGLTAGVFQFESAGMQGILKQVQPDCLEDISALNALYRPGPIQSGMIPDFIDRKRGSKAVEYDIPQLEPILKETYGVLIYQEQAIQIANKIAGYTLSEADLLRRAIGKKKAEELAAHREKFVSGSVANGVSSEIATKLFNLIDLFSGYGFNKSHSLAYSYLAYLTAYLKAHYPVEFMSALLTSEAGTDKVVKYIAECKELGIEVKPPDVNKSDFSFTPDGDSIRFGLGAVKMTGEGTVAAIIEGRSKNPYKHIYDFCSRSNVNKRVVESLVRAGAFDSTGANRAQIFEAVENAVKAGSKEAKNRKIGQNSFFMDDEEDEEVYSDIPDWSIEEKLKGEREAIGIFVSGHPLDKHKGIVSIGSTHRTDEMKSLPKESIVTLCCLLTGIEIKTSSKNGSKWAAMRLDDGRGSVEAMCFAKTYANVYGHISEDNAVAVRAVVISDEGETTKLSIQEIIPLAAMSLGRPKALSVTVEAEESKAQEMRAIVNGNRGPMPLYLQLQAEGFSAEMEIAEGVEFAGSLVEAVAGVGLEVRVLVG